MSRRTNYHSRKLVIKPSTNEDRDLFLDLSAPMLSEIDAKVNSSLNRIDFELIGEYEEVDRLISQLRSLENMIYNALHPDKNGKYGYHANLLSKLHSPPVNLDLYASALGVYGYFSESLNEQLVTSASLDVVTETHGKIIPLRKQIEGEFNRDIERFLIGIALELESKHLDQIVNIAIQEKIFIENQYGYQFAISPVKGRTVLLELLGIDVTFDDNIDELDSDFSLKDFGFEGGKIVFMKNGQELDENELEFESD